MKSQGNQKPTLIYFNGRGSAQVIRSVLLETGVGFDQIFVSIDGFLDPQVIKKYKIDMKKLPYLVHKGLVICGQFPIIKYCCLQFNRPDLLGNTLEDSILVAQIMAKQMRQKGLIIQFLFKGLTQVVEKQLGQAGIEAVKKKVIQTSTGKQLIPLKNMFMKNRGFICGYLTILDFFYYDKTFYAATMLKNSSFTMPPEVELMRLYKKFFESTDFWKKNQQKLSQYKTFFPGADSNINEIVKQIWH